MLHGHIASTEGARALLVGRNVHQDVVVEIRRPDAPEIIARRPLTSPIQTAGPDQTMLVDVGCDLARELVSTGLRFWLVNPDGQFSDRPAYVQNTVGLHPNDPCAQ